MANEITIKVSIIASKGGASVNSTGTSAGAGESKTMDMTGTDMANFTQSIPTTAAGTLLTIPAGIVGANHLFIRNLDATNFVKLSVGTGTGASPNFADGYFCKLLPLETMKVAAPTATIYAVADTAACAVQIVSVEV